MSNWTTPTPEQPEAENQQVEQEQDNPAGTETADEIEPTMHQDEQVEQQEVNDAIEDVEEPASEEPEGSES